MTISAEAESIKGHEHSDEQDDMNIEKCLGGGCFPWTLSQQLVTSDYYLDLLLDPHRPPTPLQYLQ